MTKKNTKIFVTVISILFVLTVAYFIGSIIYTVNSGKRIATEQFESFVKDISLISEQDNYFSDDFISKAKQLINTKNHVAAVLLSTNNETFLAYPITSDYLYMDTTGNPVISVSSPMVKVFTSNVYPLNNSNLLIKVAAYTLLPSSVFYYGRIAFIIILVCTLVILFVLITSTKSKDNKTEQLVSENDSSLTKDNFSLDDIDIESDEITESSESPLFKQEDSDDKPNVSDELITDEFTETKTLDDSDSVTISDVTTNTTSQKVLEPEDSPLTKTEDPTGLFSDVTGFGWESYFEPRLDSELIRSASSEQDLGLFYISIDNLENNPVILPEVCKILLDYFKFRDLIFEHGKNSFACIYQNADLNSSMILAEDIFTSLTSVVNSSETKSKIAIGISNRSIRLISGSRIMEETEQALSHAKQEKDLPIVAYKVNPDKYRQYLAEENARIQKTTVIDLDNYIQNKNIPTHV